MYAPTPHPPSFVPRTVALLLWHGGVCWWCRVLLWNGKYKLNFDFHNLLRYRRAAGFDHALAVGGGGRGMQGYVSSRLALLWDLARCSPSSLLCGREKECGLYLFLSSPPSPPRPHRLLRLRCSGCMPWCGGVVVDYLHSIPSPLPRPLHLFNHFPFFSSFPSFLSSSPAPPPTLLLYNALRYHTL